MTNTSRARRLAGAALIAVTLVATMSACDSDFWEVTNPGPIQDEALDNPSVFPALVTGMSADFSYAFSRLIRYTSIFADDLAHSGSYNTEGFLYRGVWPPEEANTRWGEMHRARWVAEDGLRRMAEVWTTDQFEASPLTTRALLFAGFANRTLGENNCVAIIDGSAPMDVDVHFERADSLFSEAVRLAGQQGETELRNAALGGRASARAWQGDWAGAVADAQQVPMDFTFEAIYSLNSTRERNDLWYETHQRFEYSVYNTRWAEVGSDPRVAWDTLFTPAGDVRNGQDGFTPAFQQQKYPEGGSNIPLTHGREMGILMAEAALRDGDVEGFEDRVNAVRSHEGLDAVSVGSEDEAWEVLDYERGATVWIEGRRLWDLRRWYDEGRNDFFDGRDSCVPISEWERDSNPNVS